MTSSVTLSASHLTTRTFQRGVKKRAPSSPLDDGLIGLEVDHVEALAHCKIINGELGEKKGRNAPNVVTLGLPSVTEQTAQNHVCCSLALGFFKC